MKAVNWRAALSLGLAATSAALVAADAGAQQVPAAGGKEVAPGVHRVEHGKRESMIPGLQERLDGRHRLSTEGEISIRQPDAQRHGLPLPGRRIAGQAVRGDGICRQPGDLWTCKKGILEETETENIGAGVAIMRIINLLPA
jgi:hypothetical protein